jgi:O-antigen ligase
MQNKLVIHLCFLIPFVITALNLQVLCTYFISVTLAQLIAYANMGLITLGTVLVIKFRGELSKTARLWIIFYIIYFVFAILAGALNNNNANILLAIIPFMYTLGFYYYLSLIENRFLFEKVALISFVLSCGICIYWNSINFDLDYQGVHKYVVDRAQGVYGDANNMALVTIISFIFVYKIFKPIKRLFKLLRLFLLCVIFYSLFITFSNTGFMVFIISIVMLNLKIFKGIKLVFGILLLPVIYFLLLNLNNLTANIDLVGQQRNKVNNIVNILSFNFDEVDDSGRGELAAEIIYYINENPLIGNGVEFGNRHQAHNTYLGVWVDAGLFSIVFFLFMLGKHFQKALESPPDIRFFAIPILIALCMFMLSLHSVINQPYLMATIIYLGYLVDFHSEETERKLR